MGSGEARRGKNRGCRRSTGTDCSGAIRDCRRPPWAQRAKNPISAYRVAQGCGYVADTPLVPADTSPMHAVIAPGPGVGPGTSPMLPSTNRPIPRQVATGRQEENRAFLTGGAT